MNTQNLNADLASLKAILAKLQSSPGEFTPLDQKLVDDLEARVASLAPDIPVYVPHVAPPGPMPAHSASPPNPSNPAFRPSVEPITETDLPPEANPAVAPNPTMAMAKVVDFPDTDGATERVSIEPTKPKASKAPAKVKTPKPVKRVAPKTKAKVKPHARKAA